MELIQFERDPSRTCQKVGSQLMLDLFLVGMAIFLVYFVGWLLFQRRR